MGSSRSTTHKTHSTSRRGRLHLDKLATVGGPAHRRREDLTQDMQIAPQAFDGSLTLGERFQDQGEIAHGGMSSIHRVLDRSLLRHVAMKVMSSEWSLEAAQRNRFIKEAQITGQLEHPNIVPIYEIGVDDRGLHFFTMKLIRGETLGEFLKSERRAHPEDALYRALQVFLKVCDALSFAHSRGVLHRDVKPSNIMVGEYGQVYLMDWGIATLRKPAQQSGVVAAVPAVPLSPTETPGTVIGTYAYMSPEQAQGRIADVDERSDVFSLGGVLYFILAGRPPLQGQNDADTLRRAQACAITPPEQVAGTSPPPVLASIAMKALAREPRERHSSAQELKAAVEEVLRGRWRFPVVRFPRGTLILREGEAGHEAFVIRSGRCQVFREVNGRRHALGVLGPGDVFGETAVFTGQPRNASVEAIEEVELWVVAGKILLEELGLDSWMGAFVSSLGQRFSERSNAVTRLQGEMVRERLLREVLLILTRHGRRDRRGVLRVPWRRVRLQVCQVAGCGEGDLRTVVEGAPFFELRLDLARPELRLRAG